MGPNRPTSNPFLGAPASFERLDNSTDKKPIVSAMESVATTQETNSLWNEFLTPKSEAVAPETPKPVLETVTFSEPNVRIGGMTEISFNQTPVEVPSQSRDEIPVPLQEVIKPKISLPIESTVGTTINVTKKVTKLGFGTGKDVKTAIFDLFKTYVLFKVESPEDKKKSEAKKGGKKAAPIPFVTGPGISGEGAQMRAKQAEDINRRLKNTNLAYEGVLNADGSVRADIQQLLDKVNSELQEADIKRKKDAALQAVSGASKKGGQGPRVSTNLNLSAEDANNVTKLLG